MCVLFLRWFLKNLLYEEEEDEDFFLFYPGAFIILHIYICVVRTSCLKEREKERVHDCCHAVCACVSCVCV